MGFGKKLAVASVVTIAAALGISQQAVAGPTVDDWTLKNVTFKDGSTASGSFVTDAASGNLLSADISTSAGTTLGAVEYNTSSGAIINVSFNAGFELVVLFPSGSDTTEDFLNFSFADPFANAPAIDLLSGASQELGASLEFMEVCDANSNCVFSSGLGVTGGEADLTNPVPEPSTLAVFVLGLAGLGLARRRQAGQRA